jgi:hypothetical protein
MLKCKCFENLRHGRPPIVNQEL